MTESNPYVSRGGLKLEHALRTFGIDVSGLTCVDMGCSTGGFTDCLLRHGAAIVYAVDTGYGVLDYRLRTNDRVTVMERCNVLHAEVPRRVDLAVIDLGWTPQRRSVGVALTWLDPGGTAVTLIKPHYELTSPEKKELLHDGRLSPADAERMLPRVLSEIEALSVEVVETTRSPITGRKSAKGRGAEGGNIEFLAMLRMPHEDGGTC